MACGILVPGPGIEPGPSAVRVQSPNHWTAREVPCPASFLSLPPDTLLCSHIKPLPGSLGFIACRRLPSFHPLLHLLKFPFSPSSPGDAYSALNLQLKYHLLQEQRCSQHGLSQASIASCGYLSIALYATPASVSAELLYHKPLPETWLIYILPTPVNNWHRVGTQLMSYSLIDSLLKR